MSILEKDGIIEYQLTPDESHETEKVSDENDLAVTVKNAGPADIIAELTYDGDETDTRSIKAGQSETFQPDEIIIIDYHLEISIDGSGSAKVTETWREIM